MGRQGRGEFDQDDRRVPIDDVRVRKIREALEFDTQSELLESARLRGIELRSDTLYRAERLEQKGSFNRQSADALAAALWVDLHHIDSRTSRQFTSADVVSLARSRRDGLDCLMEARGVLTEHLASYAFVDSACLVQVYAFFDQHSDLNLSDEWAWDSAIRVTHSLVFHTQPLRLLCTPDSSYEEGAIASIARSLSAKRLLTIDRTSACDSSGVQSRGGDALRDIMASHKYRRKVKDTYDCLTRSAEYQRWFAWVRRYALVSHTVNHAELFGHARIPAIRGIHHTGTEDSNKIDHKLIELCDMSRNVDIISDFADGKRFWGCDLMMKCYFTDALVRALVGWRKLPSGARLITHPFREIAIRRVELGGGSDFSSINDVWSGVEWYVSLLALYASLTGEVQVKGRIDLWIETVARLRPLLGETILLESDGAKSLDRAVRVCEAAKLDATGFSKVLDRCDLTNIKGKLVRSPSSLATSGRPTS
jgi:hypothetical protein